MISLCRNDDAAAFFCTLLSKAVGSSAVVDYEEFVQYFDSLYFYYAIMSPTNKPSTDLAADLRRPCQRK